MKATESHGSAQIAATLKNRMIAGEIQLGAYLSSIRTLSHEFGCAPLTAQRALKLLSDEGLVIAEPRRGYRATRHGMTPKTHETVAFLELTAGYELYLGEVFHAQLAVLQNLAIKRGWISAVLPYKAQSPEVIAEQLRNMGATALILQDIGDQFPPGFPSALMALGLPTVGLDESSRAPGMDLVLRDEMQGATLAAEHLIRKGHRKIGWYGPLKSTFNARRRFAGAADALMRADIGIDAQGWCEIENAPETEVARKYLQRADRPRAILALWQSSARALARAARELGLKLGDDFEIVGWSLDEHLDSDYIADCPELRKKCAAVTWSLNDVAHTVFNRIEDRRREPGLPTAKLLLPMKLRVPASGRK